MIPILSIIGAIMEEEQGQESFNNVVQLNLNKIDHDIVEILDVMLILARSVGLLC